MCTCVGMYVFLDFWLIACLGVYAGVGHVVLGHCHHYCTEYGVVGHGQGEH
jgi:hypothetical protein